MITGFNTDVEHNGVVYHVQTEDKGLETPVILSLVYVGGAILASKRSPYDDLIGDGFDPAALSERLNRQHKLICAAIASGRIEELKRLNKQGNGATAARNKSRQPAKVQPATEVANPILPGADTTSTARVLEGSAQLAGQPSANIAAQAPSKANAPQMPPSNPAGAELPSWFEATSESANTLLKKAVVTEPAETEKPRKLPPKVAKVASSVALPAEQTNEEIASPPTGTPSVSYPVSTNSPPVVVENVETIPVEVEGELHVSLMEERDYKAGEIVTLRVRVARGPLEAREAVAEAAVTVKVLGTEFRPLILSSKTDRDGVAVVHAWLPRFTSGRAAILVRAVHDGFVAELRRVVRHV